MNKGDSSFKNDNSQQVFRFLDLMKNNSGTNYMDSDSTAGFNAFASGEAAMIISGEFALLNAETINPNLNVGLFGIPSTDNPEDAKLDVDVGICIAVNKNSKHLEETLEVLDYISDNNSRRMDSLYRRFYGCCSPCDGIRNENERSILYRLHKLYEFQ